MEKDKAKNETVNEKPKHDRYTLSNGLLGIIMLMLGGFGYFYATNVKASNVKDAIHTQALIKLLESQHEFKESNTEEHGVLIGRLNAMTIRTDGIEYDTDINTTQITINKETLIKHGLY